jgi:hypothetical protein
LTNGICCDAYLSEINIILRKYTSFFLLEFFSLFIYSHVHTLFGPFLSPAPAPSLSSPTLLASRQNLFCPYLQFYWREDISNNKKDIVFLLVEIRMPRIAREIPSIASMYECVITWIDSSLPDFFTTSQSPSRIDHCHFKVTVLAPLQ